MENDEVGSALSNEQKITNLSKWLDGFCDYYMAMGVSFDEFWYGDYCRLKYYERAYFNKLKKRDYDMWLSGAYVYQAVSVALARGFGGDKRAEYPKQPFGYEKPEEQMSQKELLAYIQQQLEEEARNYARTHRSK